MKILVIITGLGVGGAERLVTGLADRFAAWGHDVVLAYLKGPAAFTPKDSSVRLVDLRMSRRPWHVAQSLWRLRRLIRDFEPDVVNSHLVHANILTRLLRLVTPMACLVSSAHNTVESGRLRLFAFRLTDRLADISTNVSDEAVKAFVASGALREGRMVAIDNGIDTQLFHFDLDARDKLRNEFGLSETTPLVLAAGRLHLQKDYPNLLQALERLHRTECYPRLVVVGDGPKLESLSEMVKSKGLASQVEFHSSRRDIADLMSACDVFVLSSAWEGLPLVIAEAMACERVVVATDCGGVKHVLGKAGFLVPSRNPEALADSLAHALSMSPEERDRMGRLGRGRIIEHFSLNATASRYLDVFRGSVNQ